MKVDRNHIPETLACPTCGARLGNSVLGNAAVEVAPEPEPEPEPESEVIRSGGSPTVDADLELPALEDELEPIPERDLPVRSAVEAADIPAPRREEYKVPDLISNIGERARTPDSTHQAPKIDASRLATTDDERLAPEPEEEEGAVKTHVARKITGWDLDEDDWDSNRKSSEGDATLRRKLSTIGIAVVSALFLGLIVYGVARSLKEKETVERVVEKPPEEVARESLTELERDAMDKSKEIFAAAGEAIEKFLNAENFTERLEFVRDPERVKPLMEEFYAHNMDSAFKFRPPENGWIMHPFETFLLANVESEDFRRHAVAVERQESGEFLVDWESFVGYCEIPWDQISERKSQEPFLIRAKASIGQYYNYGYTDSEWACIELKDADSQHTIYGYVEFSDTVLDDLKASMSLRGQVHITLEIAHPGEGKADNQFLIKKVIAKGWVYSETSRLGEKNEGSDAEDDSAEDEAT